MRRALPALLLLLLGLARAAAQMRPRRVGVSALGEETAAGAAPEDAFSAGMKAGIESLQAAAAGGAGGGIPPDLLGNLQNLGAGTPELAALLKDPEAMQAKMAEAMGGDGDFQKKMAEEM